MRASAIAALVLALPLFAAGTSDAWAGGWCDRPAAAYYGAPYGYGYSYGYRYGYAPRVARYYYGYAPRVVGYGPFIGYRSVYRGYGWDGRRRGFFGFGVGW